MAQSIHGYMVVDEYFRPECIYGNFFVRISETVIISIENQQHKYTGWLLNSAHSN